MVPEYTTIATIIRKTKDYGRVQQKKKQAAFLRKQGLKKNVKRAGGEVLLHAWGNIKRALFIRAQFIIRKFIFEFSVSFL